MEEYFFSSLDVIKAGSRWRVGNGDSVKIWGDHWLPSLWTFQVQTLINPLSPQALVRELMLTNNKGWNTDIIESIFWAHDAEIIKAIPLGSMHNKDKLIWHFTKDGCFSVRSAHHLIMNRGLEGHGNNDREQTSTGSTRD